MPEQNLVLTGFMGTGKTTVGRALAQMLEMEFIDADELIESRHGPIPRIFAEHGESEFRAIEQEVARELGERSNLVIATGGRMVLDAENLRALSRNGQVFCLVASPAEIYRRLSNDGSDRKRPLLQVDDPMGRIVELMAERSDDYGRFTQIITDHAEPDDVAYEIARLWESRQAHES